MGIALPQLIFVRLSLSVAHQLGMTIEVRGKEEDARSDDLQKSVPKPAFYNPEIDFCCMLKFEYVHRSRPRDRRLQLLLLPRSDTGHHAANRDAFINGARRPIWRKNRGQGDDKRVRPSMFHSGLKYQRGPWVRSLLIARSSSRNPGHILVTK